MGTYIKFGLHNGHVEVYAVNSVTKERWLRSLKLFSEERRYPLETEADNKWISGLKERLELFTETQDRRISSNDFFDAYLLHQQTEESKGVNFTLSDKELEELKGFDVNRLHRTERKQGKVQLMLDTALLMYTLRKTAITNLCDRFEYSTVATLAKTSPREIRNIYQDDNYTAALAAHSRVQQTLRAG